VTSRAIAVFVDATMNSTTMALTGSSAKNAINGIIVLVLEWTSMRMLRSSSNAISA
jgi:hypothetical protein